MGGVMEPPDTRVERARSSPSALREPLTRHALGRSRKTHSFLLPGILGLSCCLLAAEARRDEIRHSDYLVLRSLTVEPEIHHIKRVMLPNGRRGFAADTPILDLNSFVVSAARLAKNNEVGAGESGIWIQLTPDGNHRLAAWKPRFSGERLGVFVKGKLVDLLEAGNPIGSAIVFRLSNQAAAAAALRDLRNGGAPE